MLRRLEQMGFVQVPLRRVLAETHDRPSCEMCGGPSSLWRQSVERPSLRLLCRSCADRELALLETNHEGGHAASEHQAR